MTGETLALGLAFGLGLLAHRPADDPGQDEGVLQMSRIKKGFRWVRKTKRRTAIATVLALLVPAASAFAFYTLVFSGTGQTSGTLGGTSKATAATYVVSDTGLTGLVPGGTSNYTVNATVASGTATVNEEPNVTVTTSDPANCLPSWFVVTPATTGITYPVSVGTSSTMIGKGTVAFTNTATDQTNCAGDTVTVTATS